MKSVLSNGRNPTALGEIHYVDEIRLSVCEKDGFHFIISATNDFINLLISLLHSFCFYDRILYKGVIKMSDNKLINISMDFAVRILKLCENIKGHYSIVNQLERSATSIGANIREANYAHSKPDCISTFQRALKECYETEYWLELFDKAGLVSSDVIAPLLHDCGNIRRLLVASINTAKNKKEDK